MRLIDLFRTPDDFAGRPTRYAWNQLGHAAIGFALALAAEALGLPGWSALAVPVLWEAGQLRLHGADLSDALEDVGFFTAGALAHWHPVSAALAVLFFAAGIARRRKARLAD